MIWQTIKPINGFRLLVGFAARRCFTGDKSRNSKYCLMPNIDLFKPSKPIRGFTLIELLVVIAILGILSALLLPVLSKAKNRASQVTDLNNLKEQTTALNLYCSDHDDIIPWPNWDGGKLRPPRLALHGGLELAASGGIQGGDRTVLDRPAQPQALPLPDGQSGGPR